MDIKRYTGTETKTDTEHSGHSGSFADEINAAGQTVSEILNMYDCTLEDLLNINTFSEDVFPTGFYNKVAHRVANCYYLSQGNQYITKNVTYNFYYDGDKDFTLKDWVYDVKVNDFLYVPSGLMSGLYQVTAVDRIERAVGLTLKYITPESKPVDTYINFFNSQGLRFCEVPLANQGYAPTFIPETYKIHILKKTSGGIEEEESTTSTEDGDIVTVNSTTTEEVLLAAQKVFTWYSSGIRRAGQRHVPTAKYSYVSTSYFILFGRNEDAVAAMYLPVFPQEFSDSNSSSFAPTSILGRSVQYQTYNSSSRTFSVSLNLHEELCDDYTYIHRLAAVLQSACYPNYSSSGSVDPVEIMLVIGSQVKIRGILNSVQENWSGPVIDDQLVHCTLSINITETTGPYEQTSISGAGSIRGTNVLSSNSSKGYDVISSVNKGNDISSFGGNPRNNAIGSTKRTVLEL